MNWKALGKAVGVVVVVTGSALLWHYIPLLFPLFALLPLVFVVAYSYFKEQD
jgi:hypothetical protein